MAKTTNKSGYPEIDEIRSDLDSLRTNVVELTRHIQANGIDRAHQLTDEAYKRAELARKAGAKEIKKVEGHVKAHPTQSLAMAFAAGLVLSALVGRRS